MSENVLVAGATGGKGRLIVSLLAADSAYRPVAMVRKQEQAAQFEAEGIATVLGDLTGDLANAPAGVDKVIFAAGSAGDDVRAVDEQGTKRFIDACKASGVKKFVMLSSMGADDPYRINVLREYLLAKQAADNHLKASGLTYSICQPGYLNDGPARGSISIADHMVELGNISRKDVAAALVASLPDAVARNRLYVIWDGDIPIQQALGSLA